MATEYIFTISSRDKEHTLDQNMILELGFPDEHPNKLIEGIQNIVDILKILKTPEKVAEFMMENAKLTKGRLLTKPGNLVLEIIK